MCWLRDTLVGVRKAGLALAPFTPGATGPWYLWPLPACWFRPPLSLWGPFEAGGLSAGTFLVHRLKPIPLGPER